MPVNHDSSKKSILLSNTPGTLSLRIDCGEKCLIDQAFVRGTQILAESSGAFTAVNVGGARPSSLSLLKNPLVSVEKELATISDIRFGNNVLQIEEQWSFRVRNDSVFWRIERIYHGKTEADEILLPLWNFLSLDTWTAAILGTGGVAWFKLFDTPHATYGVHTDTVAFWNAQSGSCLKIVARPGEGQFVASRFSRQPKDRLSCSFAVADRELVHRYDREFHRRRYLTDREDVWSPAPVSGSVNVEYELTAVDYEKEYDRGTLVHFDKKAVGTLMNTIARIGVIDKNLHGSNSWRTQFGPICLHEQFVAQIGLALDGGEYLEEYKRTLNYFRDHAIGPDGRVKARWAYTCEDAMPGTCDDRGFYEAQWGYLLDSNCDFVANVAELFDLTGDVEWLRGHKTACERALDFLLKRDTDGDGLVEVMTDSHREQRGSDWIDVIWASHRNAFVNAKLYYALTLWSDIEELLGDPQHGAELRDCADRLKKQFNRTTNEGGFWDPGNQWYVYWLDRDNSVHGNNLVMPVNFMAIAYGICDDRKRISAVLDRTEKEMQKENLFAWPLCMFSFASGEGMEFQYPFPNYENGDIFLAWGEVGVRAYAPYDPRIAVKYIERLLVKYTEDGLAFQRYSRLTQKGMGDDILANNCLTVVGLYRNIYGIQPKYNRIFLDPHITAELEGTIVHYQRKGQRYLIKLNPGGCEVSIEQFELTASRPFGVNAEGGKLEYFQGSANRPSMILGVDRTVSVHVRIEEWANGRKWTERCSPAEGHVAHRVCDLTPHSEYGVFQNEVEVRPLKANGSGEAEFEIMGGYDGEQDFELRPTRSEK